MKESVIKRIFNGEEGSNEAIHRRIGQIKNKKEIDRMLSDNNVLKTNLSSNLFSLHMKCLEEMSESHCIDIENYFVEGFKLGFQIAIECLND